ncbi:MAG: hypothetical protein ACTTG8_06630 [Catonella sp.]|uniref:hypothetical protein n=1 Tax=Catonella sp. TaxID=2382125 RepID=UPI003F9FCFEA
MKKCVFLYVAIGMMFIFTACNKEQAGTKIKKQNLVEKAISAQVNKEIDEQVKKLEQEEQVAGNGISTDNGDQIVTQNGSVIGAASDFEKQLEKAKNQKAVNGIDYDLTTMGKDMVYATVYLMMTEPDDFEGKKFKMRGQYLSAYYEPKDAYYNYCFISDAAGCCSQGIEFATKKNLKYPEDFPKDETNIEVVGEFESYMEDGKLYCHLKDSQMTVLKDEEN